MLFSFLLFISVFLYSNQALADSGDDRCAVRDCICRVIPGSPPEISFLTSSSSRSNRVYFQEGSSEISNTQNYSVSYFLENIGNQSSPNITILGYTDGCGSHTYNSGLASERAYAVRDIIKRIIPKASVTVKVIGERTPAHSAESRRVDIIVHTSRSLTTRIERIPADYYLIDASGSMWEGWRGWQDVVNASLKPGSKVYLSIMTGCSNGTRLSSVTPQSGTEIWYSYWKILEFMSYGQTLLIVSDFESNYSLTRREREIIENRVREKNITVWTISP